MVQNVSKDVTFAPRIELHEVGSSAGVQGRRIDGAPIVPGGVSSFWLPAELWPLGVRARYAGLVTTEAAAAAIVRTDWPTTHAGGAYESQPPAHDLVLPLVIWGTLAHTHITVQTVDTERPASVQAELYDADGTRVFVTDFTLEPGRAADVPGQSPEHTPMDPGRLKVGHMVLHASSPIAAVATLEFPPPPEEDYGASIYSAVPLELSGARLIAPLFRAVQRSRPGDPSSSRLDTGIAVSNVQDTDVAVHVVYRGSDHQSAAENCRGLTFTSPEVTIPGNGTHIFYQGDPASQNLPHGCFGSAEIIASNGLVNAIVNEARDLGADAAAYTAVSEHQLSSDLFLPLFRSEHVGLSSGIAITNPGQERAEVTVRFSAAGSSQPLVCRAGCELSIDPGASAAIWPPSIASIPRGTFGSAVIQSSRPIAAIVNEIDLRGPVDMTTYTGLIRTEAHPPTLPLPLLADRAPTH